MSIEPRGNHLTRFMGSPTLSQPPRVSAYLPACPVEDLHGVIYLIVLRSTCGSKPDGETITGSSARSASFHTQPAGSSNKARASAVFDVTLSPSMPG